MKVKVFIKDQRTMKLKEINKPSITLRPIHIESIFQLPETFYDETGTSIMQRKRK